MGTESRSLYLLRGEGEERLQRGGTHAEIRATASSGMGSSDQDLVKSAEAFIPN